MILKAEATLSKISTLADRGMSLVFHTQEMPIPERVKAMEYHGSHGWLLFKESAVQDKEIPDDEPTDNSKTPSQRLRAVLYVLWKQTASHTDMEPEDFYKREMEKIINGKKQLLDEEHEPGTVTVNRIKYRY